MIIILVSCLTRIIKERKKVKFVYLFKNNQSKNKDFYNKKKGCLNCLLTVKGSLRQKDSAR
jgi:hypothetical protein